MISYSSSVGPGLQQGRTIGFPTLNLDPTVIPAETKQGVYASWVTIAGKKYKGALYFGPRLVFQETHLVLEIYVLDFNQEIYGQTVSFTLESYIRGVQDFPSLPSLTEQLKRDVQAVAAVLYT